MPFIVPIIVVAIVLVVSYRRMTRTITRLDDRCKSAWQTVDEQLQRRNDLVSELVGVIRSDIGANADVLQSVQSTSSVVDTAKSTTTPEQKMSAAADLTGELNNLFVLTDGYAELKANERFVRLHEELSDCENKLSYARIDYNDCVAEYNDSIDALPSRLIVGSKYRKRAGFEQVGDTARYTAIRQ